MSHRFSLGTSAASVLLVAAVCAPHAIGQENLLGELYGLGVHAYYSSDYGDAYSNLSAAIEGGSKDPRVYYFRGLALASLGRAEEAQADFAKGAQLEVSGGGDQYPIGKSLERVQGNPRLAIERVRKITRIRHQQEELAKSKQYYQENQIVEEPTLGNQPDPDVAAKAVGELIDPTAEVAGGDPFAGEEGLGAGAPKAIEPTDVAGGAPPDPFGTDEPARPAGGDPFGTDEPAVPAAGGDPFGTDEPAPPAGGDPFGTDEPAAPAGGDPFGGGEEPAPPAGGDPFGGGPAAGGGGVVDTVIGGVGAALESAGAPDDRDPLDDTDEPKLGGTKEAPPAGGDPAPPVGNDPFGAEEPAPPAGGDPFGAPEEPAPPAGGDPFGGGEAPPLPDKPVPAENDPFGGGEEPAPPAGDDPFGGDGAAPAADDPFGAPAVAPAGDDPFGAAPKAEDKSDPFADDAPAGPFGAPATPADAPVDNAPSDDPFAPAP